VLSEILQFAFWMRKTGYRNSTVQTCVRALKGLARRTNLLDPESVKSYLANAQLNENRKTKVLEDVSRFYAYLKIPFIRPRYKRIETLPFIPLETEIDQLIAGVGQKSARFISTHGSTRYAAPFGKSNLCLRNRTYVRKNEHILSLEIQLPAMSEGLSSRALVLLKSIHSNGVTNWVYTRQLARLARVSLSTASVKCREFAKHGILLQKVEGREKSYRWNLSDSRARKLCELFETERREKFYLQNKRLSWALQEFSKRVFDFLPEIQSVVMFGSSARAQLT
jgi:hypothetical protein